MDRGSALEPQADIPSPGVGEIPRQWKRRSRHRDQEQPAEREQGGAVGTGGIGLATRLGWGLNRDLGDRIASIG